jgi:hypothetical protein
MAKARELEKNSDLKCKRVAERIFSGIELVYDPFGRCNIAALFLNNHNQEGLDLSSSLSLSS